MVVIVEYCADGWLRLASFVILFSGKSLKIVKLICYICTMEK